MALGKKGWTWIFIAIVILIIAILLFAYRDKIFGSNIEKPKEPVPPGSNTSDWIKESFPLNVGMYGNKIKALQKALSISADGKFGPQTKNAIINAGYTIPLSEIDYNSIVQTNVENTAYANADGVKVYNNDGTLYKTAKNGEWLGTVTGKKGAYTDKWITAYILNDIRYVDVNDAYIG